MQKVSKAYKESMKSSLRERAFIMISFGLVNQEAQAKSTISNGDFAYFSNKENVFGERSDDVIYATLEQNFSRVDGSMFFLPRQTAGKTYYDTGIVSNRLVSQALCEVTINLNIQFVAYLNSLKLESNTAISNIERTYQEHMTTYEDIQSGAFRDWFQSIVSKQEFIDAIAALVKKYAPSYGVKVYSPIIAQACLESAYGTSELAANAHNYFGLKYREGRCKTCIGIYNKVGSEQNKDGTYTSSAMKWCKFANMENGVIGYFDFTSISNYSNLKGVTSPREYLERIKADGYATSLDYVSNLMSVIEKWDLTKYDDVKEEKGMSNSPLVVYTKLSPNHSGQRTHAIDRITPHCVVGQCSIETLGGVFAPSSRQASSNYGIGVDGRVGMYVEEKNRSWCSSSNANDQRAVTIECASDTKEPYTMNDKVYASLIELCVDICKRNGKSKLIWFGDKDKTLNYSPKSDEMILTVHRWFANKSCPGNWLYSRLGDLAEKVTKRLGGAVTEPVQTQPQTPTTTTMYRVRKAWSDSKSQIGAYKILDNAKKAADDTRDISCLMIRVMSFILSRIPLRRQTAHSSRIS